MDRFSSELLATLAAAGGRVLAWCVLPNHYHVLVETPDVMVVLAGLGRLHGRSSHRWNGEELTRRRQVFHGAAEREMRSEAHVFSTINYVNHNAVRHGYADRWADWPWSSASEYLDDVGREEAVRVWRSFPLLDYGNGWDDSEL